MRFKKTKKGHTKDKQTGLIWNKQQSTKPMTWEEAKTYCASLGKGWRLPAITELQSILDYGRSKPVLPKAFSSVVSDSYWSSTTGVDLTVFAWNVNLYYGGVYFDNKTNNYYVWAVKEKKK